jgi:hypothetical protein
MKTAEGESDFGMPEAVIGFFENRIRPDLGDDRNGKEQYTAGSFLLKKLLGGL